MKLSLIALVFTMLACDSKSTECQGFQYNNPALELWQVKSTCKPPRELAVDRGEIVCACKADTVPPDPRSLEAGVP